MNTVPNAQMQVVLNQAVAIGKSQLVSVSAIAHKAGYLRATDIDTFGTNFSQAMAAYTTLLSQAAPMYPALEAARLPQLALLSALLTPFVAVLSATQDRRTTAGDQSIADLASLLRLNIIQLQALLLSIPGIRE